MDSAALLAEITQDPLGLGYAAHVPAATADTPPEYVPGSPEARAILAAAIAADNALADMLNAKAYTVAASRLVTARTVLKELGIAVGTTVLEKLEALATVNATVKWAMRFMTSEPGLDVGDPVTQSAIDALVGDTAPQLTSAEAVALKGLANVPASRAEALFGLGTFVTGGQVSVAMRG